MKHLDANGNEKKQRIFSFFQKFLFFLRRGAGTLWPFFSGLQRIMKPLARRSQGKCFPRSSFFDDPAPVISREFRL